MLNDDSARQDFFQKVLKAESKFIREIGFNNKTGLTIGSVPISSRTGIVKQGVSDKFSLSNEAMHISMLAKSLMKETKIYTIEESLHILGLKMQTLLQNSEKTHFTK